MNVPLKLKYRTLSEPANRVNRAGFRNMGSGRGKATGNSGKKSSKGLRHPIGFSGKTLGGLIRNYQGK
jgi:hypothetical protein